MACAAHYSVVDQIFIKLYASDHTGPEHQKVGDDIPSEFKGIINYAVIGLMQLELGQPMVEELQVEQVDNLYHKYIAFAKNTMLDKNMITARHGAK